MAQPTETQLRELFQAEAAKIDVPADLVRAGTASTLNARRQRRRVRALGGALLVGAVAASVIFVVNLADQAPDHSAPGSGGAATLDVKVYYLNLGAPYGDGAGASKARLIPEIVTTSDTGDLGYDAVQALLESRPTDPSNINGFNMLTVEPNPIAEVNSVMVADDVITVDLTADIWDPFPAIDCLCPSGQFVMQQLVWTLQSALNTDATVALTINGAPAKGIWLSRLDGPVGADLTGLGLDDATESATVDGLLVAVGGPPGTPNTPLAGSVSFESDGGEVTAVDTTDGTFRASLELGRYIVTGTSPAYASDSGDCQAEEPLIVDRSYPIHVRVVCQRR